MYILQVQFLPLSYKNIFHLGKENYIMMEVLVMLFHAFKYFHDFNKSIQRNK